MSLNVEEVPLKLTGITYTTIFTEDNRSLADKALASGPQARAPVDNGPQEGDYSAWVVWEKG